MRAAPARAKRRQLTALAVACVIIGVGTAAITMAAWNSSQSVTGNAIGTGTIDLTATPASSTLDFPGHMVQGDTITRPVTVKNTGTSPMRYSVVSQVQNNDAIANNADGLYLTIKVAGSAGACTAANWGSLPAAIYDGKYGTTSGVKVIGDKTTGQQAGDRVLVAGASEYLCLRAGLSRNINSAPTGLTGQLLQSTLNFDAEQTVNN